MANDLNSNMFESHIARNAVTYKRIHHIFMLPSSDWFLLLLQYKGSKLSNKLPLTKEIIMLTSIA